ncbi:hypothetical protein Tco_0154490 [Tanacetum coccineum]
MQAYETLYYTNEKRKNHDSKIKNRVFNVGDRVLLFNSRLKIFSGKLKTRWIGPFTVAQVFPYGTVKLSQTDGPNFKIPSGEIKVHIEVLSVLWGNRLSIPDGSLPLSSTNSISTVSYTLALLTLDEDLFPTIRNEGPRLSGSTLFPQSIRSNNSTSTAPGRASSAPGSIVDAPISNGINSKNGSYNNVYSWNKGLSAEDQSPHSSKQSSEGDIYESSRYDAILLKEDLKNTSWLHSADDKIDEGSFFGNGFKSLPDSFGPL